jgi:hypothetical protein
MTALKSRSANQFCSNSAPVRKQKVRYYLILSVRHINRATDLLSAPVFKYLIETFAQGNANLNQLLNAVWGLIQQENAQSALQK